MTDPHEMCRRHLDRIALDAVARAEFAAKLAERLLMFPLMPQPGDTWEEHSAALAIAYASEITKALHEEAERAGE